MAATGTTRPARPWTELGHLQNAVTRSLHGFAGLVHLE